MRKVEEGLWTILIIFLHVSSYWLYRFRVSLCYFKLMVTCNDEREYRKIPNISPGPIEVCKPFLVGLYRGGLIFGRTYIRKDFSVKR